jgi:metal-responsive CopG/Arc/MetJ family transcriptional regulator
MRVSVELNETLIKEIMELTGETKKSTAIAKAVELFVNRKKAVAIIRSLREHPLDYAYTNDEIEEWGLTGETAAKQEEKVTYKKGKP